MQKVVLHEGHRAGDVAMVGQRQERVYLPYNVGSRLHPVIQEGETCVGDEVGETHGDRLAASVEN